MSAGSGLHAPQAGTGEYRDRALVAASLANLSTVSALQGDLARAAQLTDEDCRIREALGGGSPVAACRMRLAAFAVERRDSAGRRLAERIDQAALDASAQAPVDLARLANVYVALGDRRSAAAGLARARRALESREHIPVHGLAVTLAAARVDRLYGRADAADERIRQAMNDARRYGLTPLVFEARLGLAAQADADGGAAGLAGLQNEARSAGFDLAALRAGFAAPSTMPQP